MKAKLKSTGAIIDVSPQWYSDASGTMYKSDELAFPKDKPDSTNPLALFMRKVADESEWEHKKFMLVLKLIDIYQAPSTNMKEIISIAERYIEALKASEQQ